MVAILNRAALTPAVLALMATALGGCMGTTYGTGVNPGAQTMSDIGGLVNITGNQKPAIDYRPRQPLAAPPAGAAPPPPGSAGVASAADWPNDPDVAARARKAGNGSNPALVKDDGYARTAALSDPGIKVPVQNDANVYWTKRGAAQQAGVSTKEQEAQTRKLMAASKSVVSVDANGNPIRKTLADPPVAYREPDPTAPTVFKNAKKFHWPWQKANPNAVASDSLVDDSSSTDKTDLNKNKQTAQ
jgi:hypothetical protein